MSKAAEELEAVYVALKVWRRKGWRTPPEVQEMVESLTEQAGLAMSWLRKWEREHMVIT